MSDAAAAYHYIAAYDATILCGPWLQAYCCDKQAGYLGYMSSF